MKRLLIALSKWEVWTALLLLLVLFSTIYLSTQIERENDASTQCILQTLALNGNERRQLVELVTPDVTTGEFCGIVDQISVSQ